MDRRDVDAFSRMDRAVVFHMADQTVLFFFHHRQSDIAVVDQHGTAHRHVTDKMPVGHANRIAARPGPGVALDPDIVPVADGERRFGVAGPNFRTLGIDNDADLVRYGTGVLHHPEGLLVGHVRRIQPDNVHARRVKALDKVPGTIQTGNSGHDLCFSLHLVYLFVSQEFLAQLYALTKPGAS